MFQMFYSCKKSILRKKTVTSIPIEKFPSHVYYGNRRFDCQLTVYAIFMESVWHLMFDDDRDFLKLMATRVDKLILVSGH